MEEVPFLECLGTKLEVKLASSGNSKNKAPGRCLAGPGLSSQQGEAGLLSSTSLTRSPGLKMEDSEQVLSGRELS